MANIQGLAKTYQIRFTHVFINIATISFHSLISLQIEQLDEKAHHVLLFMYEENSGKGGEVPQVNAEQLQKLFDN